MVTCRPTGTTTQFRAALSMTCIPGPTLNPLTYVTLFRQSGVRREMRTTYDGDSERYMNLGREEQGELWRKIHTLRFFDAHRSRFKRPPAHYAINTDQCSPRLIRARSPSCARVTESEQLSIRNSGNVPRTTSVNFTDIHYTIFPPFSGLQCPISRQQMLAFISFNHHSMAVVSLYLRVHLSSPYAYSNSIVSSKTSRPRAPDLWKLRSSRHRW